MSYGPEAIIDIIDETGWTYPVSARRLEREHAMANINIDEKGNSMMVAGLFAKADVDQFHSEDDVREKLEPVFQAIREDRREGIMGRLRRTFLGQ